MAPTPAPIAVFSPCLDIPAHPFKPSNRATTTALIANPRIDFMA
jgi:hypothetical protein